jgi:outer membrane protein assembly factor BamB
VAGPGGIGGGGTWGAATDKKRVYTSIVNSNRLNFTLIPSKEVTIGGGWVTMDTRTGKILWSTAVPNTGASNPMTVANGVLFAGSFYPTGPVYAISAKTGKILWSYETGATIYGGISVSKGCIYVGHGYKVNEGAAIPFFTAGTYLFAFCV